MYNIFIDGSYNHKNKLIGIGVYNSTNGFELAMVKDGDNVSEAEYEALQECLRYCKMNNITEVSRIFTDSKEIHEMYYESVIREGIKEFIWIPRELNSIADKLSSSYKQYTKNIKTNIIFDNNCVIKTTKIKEISKSLSKDELIDLLNTFSIDKKMSLINKMGKLSKNNSRIYKYYFNNTGKVSSKLKTKSFYLLIPLLIENIRCDLPQNNLINKISLFGIYSLLKEVKERK